MSGPLVCSSPGRTVSEDNGETCAELLSTKSISNIKLEDKV